MRIPYLLSIMMMAVLVGGCATISRQECQKGEWYSIGVASGRQGATNERLDKIKHDCHKHDVEVDTRRYLEGYAQGLIDYCQLDNAFDTGLRGEIYQHVCPPAIDAIFARYNKAATLVYYLRRHIVNLEIELSDKKYALENTELKASERDSIEIAINRIESEIRNAQDQLQSRRENLSRILKEAGYKKGLKN